MLIGISKETGYVMPDIVRYIPSGLSGHIHTRDHMLTGRLLIAMRQRAVRIISMDVTRIMGIKKDILTATDITVVRR